MVQRALWGRSPDVRARYRPVTSAHCRQKPFQGTSADVILAKIGKPAETDRKAVETGGNRQIVGTRRGSDDLYHHRQIVGIMRRPDDRYRLSCAEEDSWDKSDDIKLTDSVLLITQPYGIISFRQSDVGEYGAEGALGPVARRQGPISACDVGTSSSEAVPRHIGRRHFGEKRGKAMERRKAGKSGEERGKAGKSGEKRRKDGKRGYGGRMNPSILFCKIGNK